eukprot:GHVO01026548.1.p2 GENE.GHVO01026548.1~~GHVO01026548.1.p2  ORF type:complete len:172 (+),score=10.61 GHVO01026548.1:698-1213(+)
MEPRVVKNAAMGTDHLDSSDAVVARRRPVPSGEKAPVEKKNYAMHVDFDTLARVPKKKDTSFLAEEEGAKRKPLKGMHQHPLLHRRLLDLSRVLILLPELSRIILLPVRTIHLPGHIEEHMRQPMMMQGLLLREMMFTLPLEVLVLLLPPLLPDLLQVLDLRTTSVPPRIM